MRAILYKGDKTMSYGYTGNILHLDLSSRKHWIENPALLSYLLGRAGFSLILYVKPDETSYRFPIS